MKKNNIGKTEMMDKDRHFEGGSKVASGRKVAGLMVYRKGKKWGFCDADGNVVIRAGYDLVLPFNDGVVAVELNGKWGYIDIKGHADTWKDGLKSVAQA